jgi:zinc/manganese transport system ATP-binding protein
VNTIVFDAVSLGHGSRYTLVDVSFSIARGDFIGLLGANGSGKTTLLKAVLGLLPPVRGTIRVHDRPARRGNPQIGYVPQIRKALTEVNITGHDLLLSAVAGTRFGSPFNTAAERRDVDRVLELVQAADLARRPLAALSGGERQRVLIAQALLGSPTMLLLDEPLAGLDPNYQTAVVGLVRQIQRELGMTVLFSSHELAPLLGQIDGVLYLGRAQAVLGSVDEVITTECLSRLYGAPMNVIHVEGRKFVIAGSDAAPDQHRHAAI